jgi:hypothetical protein
MLGYGHISVLTLPFAIIGLVITLRNFKQSRYRALAIAGLVAPLGGSIVGIGITRVLVFVLPAALVSGIGLDALLMRTERRFRYALIATATLLIFAAASIFMLVDSVSNGPTWYHNYGLGGMQYGAKQVFERVAEIIESGGYEKAFVSPSWANGTHILRRFFLPDDSPVALGNADGFLLEQKELNDSILFAIPADEYANALEEPKFAQVQVVDTLAYPDGRPGFYFVKLRYADGVEAIFAEERAARLQPIEEELIIDGIPTIVEHPTFDMGALVHIFDGDSFTLARTYEANPTILTLRFATLRRLTGLQLTTGSMDIALHVWINPDGGDDPIEYQATYTDLPNDPTVELVFPDGPHDVTTLKIEILGLNLGDPRIHIRDLTLLAP